MQRAGRQGRLNHRQRLQRPVAAARRHPPHRAGREDDDHRQGPGAAGVTEVITGEGDDEPLLDQHGRAPDQGERRDHHQESGRQGEGLGHPPRPDTDGDGEHPRCPDDGQALGLQKEKDDAGRRPCEREVPRPLGGQGPQEEVGEPDRREAAERIVVQRHVERAGHEPRRHRHRQPTARAPSPRRIRVDAGGGPERHHQRDDPRRQKARGPDELPDQIDEVARARPDEQAEVVVHPHPAPELPGRLSVYPSSDCPPPTSGAATSARRR